MPPMRTSLRPVLVLHNIRSAHNVGAIFRTADAAGIEKIYLSGYTPAPIDRFGRLRGDIAKTALGAEQTVPWEQIARVRALALRLKKEGYAIIAVDQDARAVDYKAFRPSGKIALVMGNEVRGISKALRDASDAIIEIPMRGKKESLNVSVACGIVLFRVLGV